MGNNIFDYNICKKNVRDMVKYNAFFRNSTYAFCNSVDGSKNNRGYKLW